VAINEDVDKTLKEVCEGIGGRHEIRFVEIGAEGDHAYFLVQSAPSYSPTKIVATIKSVIAKKIFERRPDVKKRLWAGEFWTGGHFASTASKHGNGYVITSRARSRGTEEHCKHPRKARNDDQPALFD
jgi:REP element-mobilizing transposase RayT